MFLVLVQRGKDHETHLASVRTFGAKREAEDFCTSVQQDGKYWVFAQIVDADELVELGNPWLED